MSTIKSSNEHLTFNADGSAKEIRFQANGTQKASISSAGLFTSTTIDATALTGNLPAISGASLTGVTDSAALPKAGGTMTGALIVVGPTTINPDTAGKNTIRLTSNAANDGRILINSDTTLKVDIQANGSTFFNGGNVGIGTASPSALLDVNGTTADSGKILVRSQTLTNNNRATLFMSAINVNGQTGNVSIECIHPNNQQSDLVIRTGATDASSFGTERMRITTDGKVGIGDTTPEAKLSVGDPTRQAGATLVQSATVSGAKVGFAGVTGLWQGQLHVADTSALAAGIGGAITFGGTTNNSSGTFYASIEASKDNATSGEYGGSMIFRTRTHNVAAMGAHMVIDSSGKVGIGTTSPSSTLEVEGQVTIEQTTNARALYIEHGATTMDGIQILDTGLTTGKLGYFYSNSTNTSTRDLVRIRNDNTAATGTTSLLVEQDSDGACALFLGNAGGGRVGIGAGAPGSRLEVGGGINHGDIRGEDMGLTSYSGNYGGIAGGTIKMVSGGVGSGSGTCTWTWAAPSWKAFYIEVTIAGTSGADKFYFGGYSNGSYSSGTMARLTSGSLTAPTFSGSGQTITIACTPPGTHPFCAIEITTSGATGAPQADQISVAWT